MIKPQDLKPLSIWNGTELSAKLMLMLKDLHSKVRNSHNVRRVCYINLASVFPPVFAYTDFSNLDNSYVNKKNWMNMLVLRRPTFADNKLFYRCWRNCSLQCHNFHDLMFLRPLLLVCAMDNRTSDLPQFYPEPDMGWVGQPNFYPEFGSGILQNFLKILSGQSYGIFKNFANFYPDLTTASKGTFRGPLEPLLAFPDHWYLRWICIHRLPRFCLHKRLPFLFSGQLFM